MERHYRHRSLVATVVLGLVLLALSASEAVSSAAPGPSASKSRSGTCSLSTKWSLVVKRSGSDLVAKFALTHGPAGHQWMIFLDDDGTGFFAGSRTATSSGALSVSASTANRAGLDTIAAAASDRATGETCSAHVIF